MKRIDHAQFLALLASARVLESDGYGEKVLSASDGTLVKVFRRKRWLSTALISPYARRFVRNARLLADREILTVQVLDAVYCPSVARHLVTYQPLPGTTLRQALKAFDQRQKTLQLNSFACFVASLHQKGIYFRSLHFGNVIVHPDGGPFGLIDVADLCLHRGSLSVRQRVRNFKHILRYREDRESLYASGWLDFINKYLQAAALPPRDTQILTSRLHNLVERLPAAV